MALGTADLMPKENLYSVTDVIEKHAAVAEVISYGRIFRGVTLRREHFMDNLAPWLVRSERVSQPHVPTQTILPFVCLQAEQVSEIIEGRTVVSWRGDQFLDQTRPLVRRLVVQEAGRFHCSWDAPDYIEIRPANERFLRDYGKRLQFLGPEVCFQQLVDLGCCLKNLTELERLRRGSLRKKVGYGQCKNGADELLQGLGKHEVKLGIENLWGRNQLGMKLWRINGVALSDISDEELP